jgi:hypothetical protein
VSFEGTGTGTLDYQINEEQAVQNEQCDAHGGLVEDTPAVLFLSVSFTDAQHGLVVVAITVLNFDPATTYYDESLTIQAILQGDAGQWATDESSSVQLSVTVSPADPDMTLTGWFSASDLAWAGAGSRDTLDIKFGSYDVTLSPSDVGARQS